MSSNEQDYWFARKRIGKIIAIWFIFSYELGNGLKLGNHGTPSIQLASLQFPPNGQFFYSHYIRKSRPILLKGAAYNWPAYKHWSNVTYLKEHYGHEVFTVEFRKHFQASFPVKKNMNLSLFFEKYEKKNLYLDSLFKVDSKMMEDIYQPLPLLSISHQAVLDNLNLLISSGNTSSSFHQDGYENLLTVLSGYKDIILYDMKYTRNFDADKYSIAAGVSDMDPENLSDEDLKRLEGIPYYTARLEPGDTLYIPQYWWHQVRSFHQPNIAVGVWFDLFDFQNEYEDRNISDVMNVVKKTEVFMELLEKEPLEVAPSHTPDPIATYLTLTSKDKTNIYSPQCTN